MQGCPPGGPGGGGGGGGAPPPPVTRPTSSRQCEPRPKRRRELSSPIHSTSPRSTLISTAHSITLRSFFFCSSSSLGWIVSVKAAPEPGRAAGCAVEAVDCSANKTATKTGVDRKHPFMARPCKPVKLFNPVLFRRNI